MFSGGGDIFRTDASVKAYAPLSFPHIEAVLSEAGARRGESVLKDEHHRALLGFAERALLPSLLRDRFVAAVSALPFDLFLLFVHRAALHLFV